MSQEVWELLEQAEEMSEGPAQIALCEQAVQLADREGDDEIRMIARMDLVRAAVFGGAPDRALVAFIWCLAKYDSNSEAYSQYSYDLMWQFKWVLDHICDFPNVAKEKIRQLEDEMERHYRIEDFGLRAVHQVRWVNALGMGDLDRFKEYWDNWYDAPRDEMADCLACEQNKRVDAAIALMDYEQAAEYAAPIFSGHMSCAEVPQATHASIIPALIKLGRLDEAAEHFETGYRQIRNNPSFLPDLFGHLLYLIRVDEFAKGLEIVERHLPWAVASSNQFSQFLFYSTAALLVESMQCVAESEIKLKLPEGISCYRDDGTYELADVAKCLSDTATEIECRFNERNANQYFTQLRESYRELVMS